MYIQKKHKGLKKKLEKQGNAFLMLMLHNKGKKYFVWKHFQLVPYRIEMAHSNLRLSFILNIIRYNIELRIPTLHIIFFSYKIFSMLRKV